MWRSIYCLKPEINRCNNVYTIFQQVVQLVATCQIINRCRKITHIYQQVRKGQFNFVSFQQAKSSCWVFQQMQRINVQLYFVQQVLEIIFISNRHKVGCVQNQQLHKWKWNVFFFFPEFFVQQAWKSEFFFQQVLHLSPMYE